MASEKRIWDNCKEIGVVKKSASTRLIVQLTARDGVKYINIREQYKRKSDTDWKFGQGGFAVPVMQQIEGIDKMVTAELMVLLATAANESTDFALHDSANAVYAVAK